MNNKIVDNKFIKIDLKSFLLLSLLFHLGFLISSVPEFDYEGFKNNDEEVIKITFSNSDFKKINQMVQTDESKNKELDKNKEYFLGAKNYTFDRQTKASIVDRNNRAGKGVKTATMDKSQAKKKSSKKKKVSFSDLTVASKEMVEVEEKSNEKENQIASSQLGIESGDARSRGLSSNNDFLEDVPLGDFTKLNTQEYEFYGYYHRIRMKLEQFWGKSVQEQADKIVRSGRRMPASANHITSLRIVLNDQGEIVKVKVNSTSGIKELDHAAIESFNQAGPFPNPPKGMVKNGVAVIEWGFVVNT